MADRQPAAPTHRAYSVIRREGQDDYWLNVGLAFPHKDGGGFNIILQAFPLDGKIGCREIGDEELAEVTPLTRGRHDTSRGDPRNPSTMNAERIRALNDQLRRTFQGGKVMTTSGIN